MTDRPEPSARRPPTEREKRLAQALRANLRRRKGPPAAGPSPADENDGNGSSS